MTSGGGDQGNLRGTTLDKGCAKLPALTFETGSFFVVERCPVHCKRSAVSVASTH